MSFEWEVLLKSQTSVGMFPRSSPPCGHRANHLGNPKTFWGGTWRKQFIWPKAIKNCLFLISLHSELQAYSLIWCLELDAPNFVYFEFLKLVCLYKWFGGLMEMVNTIYIYQTCLLTAGPNNRFLWTLECKVSSFMGPEGNKLSISTHSGWAIRGLAVLG